VPIEETRPPCLGTIRVEGIAAETSAAASQDCGQDDGMDSSNVPIISLHSVDHSLPGNPRGQLSFRFVRQI